MAYYRILLSTQSTSVCYMAQILTVCVPKTGLECYRYSNLLRTSNRALVLDCIGKQQEGQSSELILLANK
jgi:hypothetical protein